MPCQADTFSLGNRYLSRFYKRWCDWTWGKMRMDDIRGLGINKPGKEAEFPGLLRYSLFGELPHRRQLLLPSSSSNPPTWSTTEAAIGSSSLALSSSFPQ